MKRNRWDLACIAGLWIAAALFYHAVIFGGQSFYYRDVGSYYLPQHQMTLDAWRAGELPLWEPKVALGYPFLSDPHSLALYPLAALMLLLPMPRAYDLFTVIHVPLGGMFVFLLLRRWKLSREASVVGAVTLMFCGFTVTTTSQTSLLRGVIWAPLALLTFEGFVARGSWRSVVATAAALAIQGSSTDPHYVLMTACLVVLSPWMHPAAPPMPLGRAFAGVGAACALAFCALGYEYLPLAELAVNSVRANGAGAAALSSGRIELANLVNLVLPVPFPDPNSPLFPASYRGGNIGFLRDIYWGLPILALAAAAFGELLVRRGRDGDSRVEASTTAPLWAPGRSALVLALATVFGFALSLGNHTPLAHWVLTTIPPLGAFRYFAKYMLVATVGMALLAGLGFEGLIREQAHCARVYVTLLCMGAVGLLIVSIGLSRRDCTWSREFVQGATNLANLTDAASALRIRWLADSLQSMALVTILTFLSASRSCSGPRRRKALILIGVITCVDLTMATYGSVTCWKDRIVTELPTVLSTLPCSESDRPPVRFISYEPVRLPAKPEFTYLFGHWMAHQLLSNLRGTSYGFEPVLESMSLSRSDEAALYELVANAPPDLAARLASKMGVQFRIYPGKQSLATCDRLREVLPRVFIAQRAISLMKPNVPLFAARLLSLPSNVDYELVSSDSTPTILQPRSVDHCRIIHYQRCRVEIDVGLSGDGLLVLLDAFYPGWTARVNGIERPIVRTAKLFRGVVVNSGDRKVVFTYEPESFRYGSRISLIAMLGILLVGLRPRSMLRAEAYGLEGVLKS